MLKGQRASRRQEQGAVSIPAAPVRDYLPFLREQAAAIYRAATQKRPWLLWELHNPWSRSASVADSWKFLELCQSEELLEQIAPFIGEDIILFDSQFSPGAGDAGQAESSWRNDRLRCPARPLQGLVVRIPLADADADAADANAKFICRPDQSAEQAIECGPGNIICHSMDLDYRVVAGTEYPAQAPGQSLNQPPQKPLEYVIRYFPATSLYVRDPATKLHRQLTERYPLLNYARMPLWLVRGEDKAGNDFAAGFQPRAGRWIGPQISG